MKWAHLIFGFAVFAAFTITGSYMRADFPDKDAIPQELRLLMRSRHIYILFSALIHLALGTYLSLRLDRWRRVLQYVGSGLLFMSSGLLLRAFILETYQYGQFFDLSRFGIYASLAGVAVHWIASISPGSSDGRLSPRD